MTIIGVLGIWFLSGGNRLEIPDFFAPLTKQQMVQVPSGDFYTLHSGDAYILQLGSEGEVKSKISQKGQGPGELSNPFVMQYLDGYLHVFDFVHGMVRFDLTGNYIGSFKTSSLHYKIGKGWLYQETLFQKDAASRLMAVPDSGEGPVPLMGFGASNQNLPLQIEGNTVAFDFNPAPDQVKIAVAVDGTAAFVYNPETGKVHIVDGRTWRVAHEIKIPVKPIPFNTEWGEIKLEERADKVFVNGGKVIPRITAKFPDYFPLVAAMEPGPDNKLWLVTGEYFMNPEQSPTHVFDDKGQPATSDLDYLTVTRLLGVRDGKGYLICYDATPGGEKPYVLVCSPDQLKEKARENNEFGMTMPPLNIYTR